MNLGLIHYSAPPLIGGVEKVVGEQIAVLKRAGHSITLCCFEGGESARADYLIRLSRDGSESELVATLLHWLCRCEVVLIHNVGTMPFHLPLTAALRALADKTPSTRWICWVHDLASGNPDYPPENCDAWRPLMENACPDWEYIAISPKRATEVQHQLGVPCRIIPNGICPQATLGLTSELSDLVESHECWDADLVLLHPCRLVRRKRIETGIQVVQALRQLGKNSRYLITAPVDRHRSDSVAYLRELKSLVQSLRLESQVVFISEHTCVSLEDLRGLYCVADALLYPGLQEGFGLPIMEATALRIPAFCPDAEPMNKLPGAIPWNANWTPEQIAPWLIRQIEIRHSIQTRKELMRSYRWSSVYRNFLAPLLHQSQHRHS